MRFKNGNPVVLYVATDQTTGRTLLFPTARERAVVCRTAPENWIKMNYVQEAK